MKSNIVAFAFLLGAGISSSAFAADYTWLNLFPNWSDDGAWSANSVPCKWANGNNAQFTTDGSTVNVSSAVTPGRITAQANTTITGSAAVTVNGYVKVSSGKTLTMEAPLNQTDTASDNRLIRDDAGTLELQGGGSMYRMQQNNGTTKVTNGSLLTITGTSTSAGASGSVFGCTGGKLVVEGEGSRLVITNKTTYLPISGTEVIAQNDGTIDASKVDEVLNGFSDNGKTSDHASITVKDGGVFIAKKIRVGKVDKSTFDSKPDYARVNVVTGGIIKCNNVSMDNSGTLYGEVNFNGGLWEVTGESGNPFNSSNVATYPWAGLRLSVREGGAHIKVPSTNRTILKPFQSGAEKDGGLTIEGGNNVVIYMNAENTFNGPTTLTGAGGLIYVPRTDAALGAAPDKPKDDIVFKTGGPILHSDTSFEVHSNRNVRIAKNVIARIGNSGHLAFRGAIRGEEGATSDSTVKVQNNWGGSLTLVPAPGRENEFGRLITEGRTVVGAGMTKLTSQVTDVNSSAVIYACGDNSAWGWRGSLDITNGTLKVTDTSHRAYLETAKWGRIRVMGGTFDCLESHEILNGHDGPGRVEVSGTGTINAYIVRVSQTKVMEGDLPAACIYLGKGGTLKFHHFNIDTNAKPKGRVDFDGGTIVARSTRENLLGLGTGEWTNILFRVCAGGVVIDTNNQKIGIVPPLLTGVTEGRDGGLTKKGSNILYVRNPANTYTGPTRTDKGQLIFEATSGASPAMPGDLEVSVAELAKLTTSERNGTYVQTPTVPANMKVRVVDVPDGFDAKSFGKKIGILRTLTPMTKIPDVVLVDADGNERSSADWRVSLSADGKTLSFGKAQGGAIIFR